MINLITNFFGSSGYVSHARGLFNALSKLTEVKISTSLPAGWETDVNDKELQAIKQVVSDDAINLIIDLPHNWRIHTKKGRNWAYCVWEGDRVPECFIDEFLNPDIEYIFCPSTHTQSAFLNTIDSLSEEECKKLLEKLKWM